MRKISLVRRVDSLYGDCLTLIERDIVHLKALSIGDKLAAAPAKDLRDYVKLLGDLKIELRQLETEKQAKKDEKAKELTAEQLEAVLKA